MNVFKFLIILVIAASSTVDASSSEPNNQNANGNSRCSSPSNNLNQILADQENKFLAMFVRSNELLARDLDYLQFITDKNRDQSKNNPFKDGDLPSPDYSRCTSPTSAFSRITPHVTQYEIGRNQAIAAGLKRIQEVQRQSEDSIKEGQERELLEQRIQLNEQDIIKNETTIIRKK